MRDALASLMLPAPTLECVPTARACVPAPSVTACGDAATFPPPLLCSPLPFPAGSLASKFASATSPPVSLSAAVPAPAAFEFAAAVAAAAAAAACMAQQRAWRMIFVSARYYLCEFLCVGVKQANERANCRAHARITQADSRPSQQLPPMRSSPTILGGRTLRQRALHPHFCGLCRPHFATGGGTQKHNNGPTVAA